MVGIVIVSHSKTLATGVLELAQQLGGAVPIALAAGIDDPEHPLGTDAMQVHQAIESVYSEEGVVVLMDLGSAVLSAEMALEFLPPERQSQVRLCEAPLVEGTIAAVVQVASGANLEEAIAAARGALAAKAAQLAGSTPAEETAATALPTEEIHLTIRNPTGLHARPAAKFVTTAAQFQAEFALRNVTTGSEAVNAKSINQVMTLGVRKGHEIAIAAFGEDAEEALAALQELVAANFGESAPTAPAPATPAQIPATGGARFTGIPASPGIAIGLAVQHQPAVLRVTQEQTDDPQREWEELQSALDTARQQIQALHQEARTQVGEEEAAIFHAHLLYLEDPTMLDRAHHRIYSEGRTAAAAWQAIVDDTIGVYQAIADPHLQARSADVADVGLRVLQRLTGAEQIVPQLDEPAVLIAPDLTPSETARLDVTRVLGICTVKGGATSHTGLLARSLGIPAVVGVGEPLSHLPPGTLVALDGETGQVWVNPDETQLHALQRQQERQQADRQALKLRLRSASTHARQPAMTGDGISIPVKANISGVAEARVALDYGASGVGLLRSEFLYLARTNEPTEEEQWQTYRDIASVLSPHPLTIRLLDIGGDKSLPYLNLPSETNPFLGWRGIRFLLEHPALLKTQLRAILRASHEYAIAVMLPMVASVREVRAVKAILTTAQAELREAGLPFDEGLPLGMMVEVPAAVTMADQLAAEVDFFSIGTNDLTQYLMAADRTNPKVANLANAFEPAVLRMVQQAVQAGHQAGIRVAVCGELASFPLAAPILLGLGVDELSMSAPAIPTIKAAIADLTKQEADAIAQEVLQLESAEAVREYVKEKRRS
jgi:phosphocarrier protein FPr